MKREHSSIWASLSSSDMDRILLDASNLDRVFRERPGEETKGERDSRCLREF